jgi:hypothetical protein
MFGDFRVGQGVDVGQAERQPEDDHAEAEERDRHGEGPAFEEARQNAGQQSAETDDRYGDIRRLHAP